jgi:hypothetical protein
VRRTRIVAIDAPFRESGRAKTGIRAKPAEKRGKRGANSDLKSLENSDLNITPIRMGTWAIGGDWSIGQGSQDVA